MGVRSTYLAVTSTPHYYANSTLPSPTQAGLGPQVVGESSGMRLKRYVPDDGVLVSCRRRGPALAIQEYTTLLLVELSVEIPTPLTRGFALWPN
jgi:hypothetical protein